MTGYVSTRYYRAPEIMLTWRRYNEKVDIWSAGCIFAEMMTGRPLFLGKNYIDQFFVITQLLGTPPDNVVAAITSQTVSDSNQPLPSAAY
jgi:p38 MAP kinase